MTEQEFATSTDPAAMLRWIIPDCDCAVRQTHGSPVRHDLPHLLGCRHTSDRKLRLFACACLRAYSPMSNRDDAANKGEAFADGAPKEDGAWGSNISGAEAANRTIFGMDRAGCANLLREIIGNPFRPVIVNEGQHALTTTHGIVLDRRWLTPTVKALATAAYQERPGREWGEMVMGRCAGCGTWEWDKCRCRIEDGTLDNDRLAVLADALEDAGCPAEIECEKCHYGWVTHFEYVERVGAMCGVGQKPCPHCGGKGSVPNPLLAHLRSDGVHVRGCWAIDLLLGNG